jgi:hypothetical protein
MGAREIMSHDCVFNIKFFRFISLLLSLSLCVGGILSQFTRTKLNLYILNKTVKQDLHYVFRGYQY